MYHIITTIINMTPNQNLQAVCFAPFFSFNYKNGFYGISFRKRSELSFFFITALTLFVIMLIPQEQHIYTFPKPFYIITFCLVVKDIQKKAVSIDMFRFQKMYIYFEFKRVEVIRFCRVTKI